MIVQYILQLKRADGSVIPFSWGYRLYAWLLQQIPQEDAQRFHEQDKKTISQYIEYGRWYISLLDQETIDSFSPVLKDLKEICLHEEKISVESVSCSEPMDGAYFLQKGRELREKRVQMQICSPAAFKQSRRYTILPDEEVLIQSLVRRWNSLFPQYLLEDSDLLGILNGGIHIVDYRLRTTRYQMKDTSIPGFYGVIYLQAQLPIVVQELWNSLLAMAPYCGIGIKTTLGMGGVRRIEKTAR